MKKLLLILLCLPMVFISCSKQEGCTDPIATNYSSEAEDDDGSCIFGIVGFWNVDSISYQSATQNTTIISDIALEFISGGILREYTDDGLNINEWIIIGDSLHIGEDSEDFICHFNITRTNLTLVGNIILDEPTIMTVNATRN